MRHNLFILILLLVLLTACNKKADAEFLVGGNWVATAGYEDGEPEDELYLLWEDLHSNKMELFLHHF